MAEAEDVITDAARHATIFARELWRRHRHDPDAPKVVHLTEVAERLELLIEAAFGIRYPLRIAQAPARPTMLMRLFRRSDLPPPLHAVPATDGHALWLPADLQNTDFDSSLDRFRVLALSQAMRAYRGSAAVAYTTQSPFEQGVYIVLEACACDQALLGLLPGLRPGLQSLRRDALDARPALSSISAQHRPLELLLRSILQADHGGVPADLKQDLAACNTPAHSLALARTLGQKISAHDADSSKPGATALLKDYWTGDYVLAPAGASQGADTSHSTSGDQEKPPRSARLSRRPKVRQAAADEDDKDPGAWMIQPAPPMEHAEDPMGMQRPIDRDDQTPAEEFADSLSELDEARLVSTPTPAKDILLSDDPPQGHATTRPKPVEPGHASVHYPEWDFRANAYRIPGTTVHLLAPQLGPEEWVDQTLERHRSLLDAIRRRFEMLRPERTRLRKQLDGDNVDLDAYIEALSDRRAGRSMSQALYEDHHLGKRNTAIMLLMDISGSTDSWLSAEQRIIDVEREALLLVCTALESVGDPYAVQAFSGEGPQGVTVSTLKSYRERYDKQIARRIAALEPDRYTRTGAALRHATATLMKEPAQHRLLLLLSDGKPNDADQYEGRYGVEDMRQAVNEARLQGVFPFCLTIDRQAANYLPAVFGARQYALLPKSEHLPAVLLDWMRRLLAR